MSNSGDSKSDRTFSGQFNSVQLNVITFVDVQKAVLKRSLDNCVWMTDNSVGGSYRGTPELITTCRQGQVINWLLFFLDMDKRPDGTYPPFAKINNLVFLNPNGNDLSELKVCRDFKIFGGPDKVRSKLTPIYYYWAGTVVPDLPPGNYKYRLVFELDTKDPKRPLYLNLNSTPSLNVIPVDEP